MTHFLLLFIELQLKIQKPFNIVHKIFKGIHTIGMYDEHYVRPAVLENKLSLSLLVHKNSEFYMLVTLQLV